MGPSQHNSGNCNSVTSPCSSYISRLGRGQEWARWANPETLLIRGDYPPIKKSKEQTLKMFFHCNLLSEISYFTSCRTKCNKIFIFLLNWKMFQKKKPYTFDYLWFHLKIFSGIQLTAAALAHCLFTFWDKTASFTVSSFTFKAATRQNANPFSLQNYASTSPPPRSLPHAPET